MLSEGITVSNDILMLVIVLRQRTKVGSTIGAYFKNIIEKFYKFIEWYEKSSKLKLKNIVPELYK